MTILYFVLFTSCFKPVILIPALYGTNLYVTYKNIKLPWYCPKSMDDELIWLNKKYIVPPLYNCLLQLFPGRYDNTTGKVLNRENVDIKIHDFGGDESVLYVDDGFFGYKFFDNYASMIEFYKSKGYQIGKDLLTAPYDWRFAPVAIYEFCPNMKKLVEKAYKINGEKVTIMGFSCGGYILQRFLSKYVSDEWKQKYVEKVVFLVPSFGGTLDPFTVAYTKKMPMLQFVHSHDAELLMEGLPFVHCHYPNPWIYGDIPLIRGPDGKNYTAEKIPEILLSNHRIHPEFQEIMKLGLEFAKGPPTDINMPTIIIYNSGYPTHTFIDFKNGWDKDPEILNGKGDGTIPSNGAEWACSHWDHTNSPVICIDLDNHEQRFRHQPLSRNPFIHEFIYNLTTDDEWAKAKGRINVQLPYITIKNDETYEIRNDIRPISIVHVD